MLDQNMHNTTFQLCLLRVDGLFGVITIVPLASLHRESRMPDLCQSKLLTDSALLQTSLDPCRKLTNSISSD